MAQTVLSMPKNQLKVVKEKLKTSFGKQFLLCFPCLIFPTKNEKLNSHTGDTPRSRSRSRARASQNFLYSKIGFHPTNLNLFLSIPCLYFLSDSQMLKIQPTGTLLSYNFVLRFQHIKVTNKVSYGMSLFVCVSLFWKIFNTI